MPSKFLGRQTRQRKAMLAFRRTVRSFRRVLAKIVAKDPKPEIEWTEVDNNEPIRFDQRVVLRAVGQIPVEAMVSFHRLVKNSSRLANRTLAWMNQASTRRGDHFGEHAAVHRAGLRAMFQERLKRTAQLSGLFMPDPYLTCEAQELFEQFSDIHGTPNEDDKELLAMIGEVTEDTVDQWFEAKEERIRPIKPLMRLLCPGGLRRYPGFRRSKRSKKPSTRH